MHRIDAYQMVRRRTAEAGLNRQARPSCVPGDRHHCLSPGRRHARNRAGRGGARKPARHEALQPITLDEVERIQI
jgi:hypothetical protein